MRSFHSIRAAAIGSIAVLLGAALPAQQPAGDPAVEVSAGFLIYVRSQQIGREEVNVVRTGEGWTITSTGRTDPPVDLTIRQVRVRYDSAWKPVELTLDATLRGQSVNSHTTITGSTAQSIVTTGGQTAERTSPVATDALLLPSPLWGPFEALARRLRTAPAGSKVPGFALQSPMQIEVGTSAEETFSTASRTIQAKRTSVKIVTAGPPLEAEIWSDQDGHLLRVSVPAQALEVIRDDFASVAVRHVPVSRDGDQTVRIPSVGFSLAATVSKPSGTAQRAPAVILVGSSGLADRDEATYGIPLFGQLANALADQGNLVVRYDKRGTGQSGGRPESAGIIDYADDLRSIIRYVRDRKDVDRKRVAIIGYADGGTVAMTAAMRDDGITALGLMSSMAVSGAELNIWQVTRRVQKSSTLTAAEQEQTITLQKNIQTAVLTGKGWEAVPLPLRQQADTEWFRSFLDFKPDLALLRIKQPMIVVQGMLDTQMPPETADRFQELSKTIKNRKQPIDVVRVPGVNHLLVEAKTGEVDEYASLRNARVSPAVIEPLAAWLKRTFAAVR